MFNKSSLQQGINLCNQKLNNFLNCGSFYPYKCVYKKRELIKDAKHKVGVYVFYSDKEILYVGKCDTKSDEWGLYSRISQHFQPSQNGLIKKVSLKDSISKEDTFKKLELDARLKYLILDDVADVNRLECYLIGTLNPKYNF